MMKKSIYKVSNRETGKYFGLIAVPTYIDIIDITQRASNKYNLERSEISLEYIGDVEIE